MGPAGEPLQTGARDAAFRTRDRAWKALLQGDHKLVVVGAGFLHRLTPLSASRVGPAGEPLQTGARDAAFRTRDRAWKALLQGDYRATTSL